MLHQAVAVAMRSQPQICWESCQAWRSLCSDSAGGGQHETAVLQSQECLACGCRRPLQGSAPSLWRAWCGWSQRRVFLILVKLWIPFSEWSVAGREEVRCLQPESSALVQQCSSGRLMPLGVSTQLLIQQPCFIGHEAITSWDPFLGRSS